MDSEAPIGAKRRGFRRWKWLFLMLLLSPVLLFFLSNLCLSTPWARGWIAGKIGRKTGLEARVGAASWSPWNGVSIRSVALLQPPALRTAIAKPLASFDLIRIAPAWRAWLRGRLEVRSITLDTPRLTLPLELLAHLSGPPSQAAPPAINLAPPPLVQVTPPVANPPPATPLPTTAAPPNVPAPPAVPSQPTGWLHLRNASFALVSIGHEKPLFEISNTTGSLPIGGDPAQSHLQIHSITAGGNPLFSNLSATMDWKTPVLSLKPVELELQKCKFLFACKIATLSGLPVQIEAQIPKQPLPPISLPFGGRAAAEFIAANAGFRGLLAAPATWQGDFVAEAAAPSLAFAGHEAKFDKGSSVTILRGGILSCVDARLIGDELSLLGNATVLASGNAAGALRIVAPPANVEAIVRNAFPNNITVAITPLNTPQRVAFDLEAFGNIGQLFLRLGKDGPIVNLNTVKPTP